MSRATKTGKRMHSASIKVWVTRIVLTLNVVEGCFEELKVL
jgi:hypothetical protein